MSTVWSQKCIVPDMKSYSNVVTSYQQSCFQELKTAMAFPRLFQQLINKNSSVDIQGRMLLWAAWEKLLPILPCGVHSVWRKLFPVSSTPSKSASLLTLEIFPRHTWIACFVWPLSYLLRRVEFPQLLLGFFHLLACCCWLIFVLLLHSIINKNFLIISHITF